MNKKIVSLLSVLLMVILFTSPVSAGGNVGLKSVQFTLGTGGTTGTLAMAAVSSQSSSLFLTATGTFTGLGGYAEGVEAKLGASGIATVTCTNQGGNQSPGQNPNISASGEQAIGPQDITKKGNAPLDVTAQPGPLTGTQGGCANDNWTAEVVEVKWTHATIYAYDAATGELLFQRDYACDPAKQTATSVSCTPVN